MGETITYREAVALTAGLKDRSESRYVTAMTPKKKRSQSEEAALLLELLDIQRAINWDKKRFGPYKPIERAYETAEDKNIIKGSKVSTAEALEIYKLEITTLTDEEIYAANREYLRKNKLKG